MPRLDDVPSGTVLFIDANILLGHFLQQQPACTSFLERVWTKDVIGVTSVLALAEVRHALLRAEVSARYGLPARRTTAYLREHPHLVGRLTESRRALGELRRWPLRLVHVTRRQFWEGCRLSERYGLLTHDAIHLATLRFHGLHDLASADRDFTRLPLPGLTVWAP